MNYVLFSFICFLICLANIFHLAVSSQVIASPHVRKNSGKFIDKGCLWKLALHDILVCLWNLVDSTEQLQINKCEMALKTRWQQCRQIYHDSRELWEDLLGAIKCTLKSFLHRLLSVLTRITWDIFNIEKRLTFQFILHFSYVFNYWIVFFVKIVVKYT